MALSAAASLPDSGRLWKLDFGDFLPCLSCSWRRRRSVFFSFVGISFSSVLNNFSIQKELGSFRGGKVHELDLVPRRIRRACGRAVGGGEGHFTS